MMIYHDDTHPKHHNRLKPTINTYHSLLVAFGRPVAGLYLRCQCHQPSSFCLLCKRHLTLTKPLASLAATKCVRQQARQGPTRIAPNLPLNQPANVSNRDVNFLDVAAAH